MFLDRVDAGKQLAKRLMKYADDPTTIVLALPRGGVEVGYEVAKALECPLEVFLVRKLGVPGFEELAMGAISSGDVRVLNEQIVRSFRIHQDVIDEVTHRESLELQRREQLYQGDHSLPHLQGKNVIIVDDGLATGSTMRAAITAIHRLEPTYVVVAVPVGCPITCRSFQSFADKVVCAHEPEEFQSVGSWYHHFDQTTDSQVQELLRKSATFIHKELQP
jgi:putative phosphoribosyl transferase